MAQQVTRKSSKVYDGAPGPRPPGLSRSSSGIQVKDLPSAARRRHSARVASTGKNAIRSNAAYGQQLILHSADRREFTQNSQLKSSVKDDSRATQRRRTVAGAEDSKADTSKRLPRKSSGVDPSDLKSKTDKKEGRAKGVPSPRKPQPIARSSGPTCCSCFVGPYCRSTEHSSGTQAAWSPWSFIGEGQHCKAYAGRYIAGPKKGAACVVKRLKGVW